MIEIPTNTAKDDIMEKAVAYIVNELKTKKSATIDWWGETNKIGADIDRAQAVKICDLFKAKGYYHEIRMHCNQYKTFFYCVTISKVPIRTDDYACSWSEYVG